jgi:paraquat-inducible protein A
MIPASPILTARAAGLIGCDTCGKVSAARVAVCPRCEAALSSRKSGGQQVVLAWLLAGIIAYVPANLYPMLLTQRLGQQLTSTIVGGAIDLLQHGDWVVSSIVLVASVLVPIGKFVAIGYLLYVVRRPAAVSGFVLQRLYNVVEFIGRWSMIDVFVVAILSALVQLGLVASVNPGPAAVAFTLSVVCTMMAARAFDPRLIWDAVDTFEPAKRFSAQGLAKP